MNSSISSSDDAIQCGRSLAAFLGALGLGALLVLAVMITVDPYDSGRFGLLGIVGVADSTEVTANASRARDPQFDSAIFGNSTGQRLNPAELSQATGNHFVQLTAPGSDPRGQLAILDFFVRHHRHIGALVFVTDPAWCTHDPAPPLKNPFPFWLYGDSSLVYAGRLFSWRAVNHAYQRIMIFRGVQKRTAPDGFFNYEDVFPRDKHPTITPAEEPAFTGQVSDGFPLATLLDGAVKKLPADVSVLVLMPPIFYAIVPRPGSREAAEGEACKAAYKRIVAGRPHSNLIDYRIDNALTRDPLNFVDTNHYRTKIALKVQEGIVASLRLGEAAKIEF
ncbi:hypothetical protein SAMN05444159_2193 [Bradyrhizobium lablabi]|uniref:Uncharacterized protein n=1 Tax=Bradyrhizobium lablabi TaxID=722472 RepID=A0A1M6P1I4_9BRAD|nr:hypothetical protein [Bradyrhizobium lablabi]SHK01778.1 hypothetical protein SAMN05444159_2193 [Bradyrhizobium lablabi]